MELRQYLKEKNITMAEFGASIERAQSIVSRLCARRHYPDPSTAINIVIRTRGVVSLDDLYDTPPKYRADRARQ